MPRSPIAATTTEGPAAAPTPSQEGAVFDFEDLQALREEYDDRIAELEKERDAAKAAAPAAAEAVDVAGLQATHAADLAALKALGEAQIAALRAAGDAQLVALKTASDTQLANEARARQELIEALSFELAAAREEGELKAMDADRRRIAVESKLHAALQEVERIEQALSQVKETLVEALAPGASRPPAPVVTQPAVAQPAVAPAPVVSSAPALAAPSPSGSSRIAPRAAVSAPIPAPIPAPSPVASGEGAVVSSGEGAPVASSSGPRLFQALANAPEMSSEGSIEPSENSGSQNMGPAWAAAKKRKIRLR